MTWPLVTVTSSTDDALSRSEAKLWLRIEEEEDAEDELVDRLVEMARQRYEEYTGRVLLQQTYDFYMQDFPSSGIELPRWPLVSISSVKGFTDTDATDTGGTAMNSSEYYTDTAREPGRVVPFGAYSWPTHTRVANAGIVRFVAGHTTSTTGVPDHIRQSIKNMVAHAYEHRGDGGSSDLQVFMDEAIRDELTVQRWG